MPKLFRTAADCPDLEIEADMELVIDRHEHFKPLAQFGLRVDVLVAYADDLYEPALSHHGSHPDAYIKVNNAELRARGLGDVTIYLDGNRHGRKSATQRHATLAHELFHISIPTKPGTTINDAGNSVIVTVPELDDYARPVVKLIPDDYTVTGFRQVAEWYRADSMEVKSHKAMTTLLEQALMPFMGEDETDDDEEDKASTVTLSASGESVTVTGAQFDRLGEVLDKMASRRAAGSAAR